MKNRLAKQFLPLAVILIFFAARGKEVATTNRPASVWPAPPNEPRIQFVQNIHGPADVGERSTGLRAFGRWLVGDKGQSKNLRKPFAVAVDEAGNLCVTDMDAKQVCLLDFRAKTWRSFDGAGKTKFVSPVSAARHDGVFYVADSELGKVVAFRDASRPLFEITSPCKRPVGLTIADGNLFVVDSQLHAVLVFGLDGTFKSQFGKRGTGPGEFNFPTAIAADRNGHVFVSDTMNCRVQVLDQQAKFLRVFGSNGDTSGHFARPKGVATDAAGRCYVVDALFDNFQIFDTDGKLLLNVGQSGGGPGEFGLPNGIAISADNRIFVADAFNHRVQVFKYIGKP